MKVPAITHLDGFIYFAHNQFAYEVNVLLICYSATLSEHLARSLAMIYGVTIAISQGDEPFVGSATSMVAWQRAPNKLIAKLTLIASPYIWIYTFIFRL